MFDKINPEHLKLALFWSGIAVLLLVEWKCSYRRPSVSKARRIIINISLFTLNGVFYYLVYASLITAGLLSISEKNLGMLNIWPLHPYSKIFLGVLLLDVSIYLWHLLNHEVPFLWRFHRVHHSDLNMDVTTAHRFHLGELLLSGLVRLSVIFLFGIPAMSYVIFEILVTLSIQFHHSSLRINPKFERFWQLLFVPPAMHRIHHSVKFRERDSNYGVILSLWDRLLGTLTTGTDQDKIIIGLGSHRDFSNLDFFSLWLLPFRRKTP